MLLQYGLNNSVLLAHASHHIPGVELFIKKSSKVNGKSKNGCGLALAYKRKNSSNRVFVINSDGEMAEIQQCCKGILTLLIKV